MTNVANLQPRFFAEAASGRKRIEYRQRRSLDPRLEAARAGEPLVLIEKGSRRALIGSVTRVHRRSVADVRRTLAPNQQRQLHPGAKFLYEVHYRLHGSGTAARPSTPGWRRVDSLGAAVRTGGGSGGSGGRRWSRLLGRAVPHLRGSAGGQGAAG